MNTVSQLLIKDAILSEWIQDEYDQDSSGLVSISGSCRSGMIADWIPGCLSVLRGDLNGQDTTLWHLFATARKWSVLVAQYENSEQGRSPLYMDGYNVEAQNLIQLLGREPNWKLEYNAPMPDADEIQEVCYRLIVNGKEHFEKSARELLRLDAP